MYTEELFCILISCLYCYYDYFLLVKTSAEVILQLTEYKLFFVGLIGSLITLNV